MTTAFIKDNLIDQISKLPYDLQLRVLDFVKALIPKRIEGKSLLRFEGAISADDLQLMSKAIEESCEKVYISELKMVKILPATTNTFQKTNIQPLGASFTTKML